MHQIGNDLSMLTVVCRLLLHLVAATAWHCRAQSQGDFESAAGGSSSVSEFECSTCGFLSVSCVCVCVCEVDWMSAQVFHLGQDSCTED